jgi:7-cyano-7-deazaguanine synthase
MNDENDENDENDGNDGNDGNGNGGNGGNGENGGPARHSATRGGGKRAVILLSGGLDSATAAALARREGFALYGLTVRYGQVHAVEIAAARAIAAALGFTQHREIDVDLGDFGGSSLVGDGAIPDSPIRQRTTSPTQAPASVPSTYVPARNTVLLSLAMAWAEVLDAERIVIGVNALDYSGYPDCRPEFIAAFEYLASLATKAGLEGRAPRIWAPLQHLTKAAIIRAGVELGLDYGLTHSCYNPAAGGGPCGRCDSCELRARGFAEAGIADPLLSARG